MVRVQTAPPKWGRREVWGAPGRLTPSCLPAVTYQPNPKLRLRWTSELHSLFLQAVEALGGPEQASPPPPPPPKLLPPVLRLLY